MPHWESISSCSEKQGKERAATIKGKVLLLPYHSKHNCLLPHHTKLMNGRSGSTNIQLQFMFQIHTYTHTYTDVHVCHVTVMWHIHTCACMSCDSHVTHTYMCVCVMWYTYQILHSSPHYSPGSGTAEFSNAFLTLQGRCRQYNGSPCVGSSRCAGSVLP